MARPTDTSYAFGPFELIPRQHLLLKGGEPVTLKPRVFDTLRVLVENAGNLMTKEELAAVLWPETVVSDGSLTQNIWLLRRALEEGEGGERYIETVPRVGYRFIAPVRRLAAGEPTALSAAAAASQEPPPPQQQPVRERDSGGSGRWRLGGLAAGAVVVLALAAFLLGWLLGEAGPGLGSGRPAVAVLGFDNLGRRPEAAWLSTALAEMTGTELAAGSRLRVVASEDVSRMKADLALAHPQSLSRATLGRVRRILGADYVVAGSFVELAGRSEPRLRVDLRLQSAITGETLAALSETGAETELFDLVTRSCAELRDKLGAGPLRDVEVSSARAAVAANPQAERLYAEGLERLRLFDPVGARELLEQAVAADPEYPLAHAALARALLVLGYETKARSEAGAAYHLAASLAAPERLVVEGHYRATLREWDRAIEIDKALFTEHPDDLDTGLTLAAAQISGGQPAAALATVARLRTLQQPAGDDPRIDLAEARAAEAVGDFRRDREATVRAAGKARPLGSRLIVAEARGREGWALYNLGQAQPALAALEESRGLCAAAGDVSCAARALNRIAGVFDGLGDYDRARQTYEQALDTWRRAGYPSGVAQVESNIALILQKRGDVDAARRLFESSLTTFREIGDDNAVALTEVNLGGLIQNQGQLAEAALLFEKAIPTLRANGNRPGLMTTLGALGNVQVSRCNLAPAETDLAEALTLCRAVGNPHIEAYLDSALGRARLTQGNLMGSKVALEEGLAAARRSHDKQRTADLLLHLGETLTVQGDLAGARRALTESLAVHRESGNPLGAAVAETALADLDLTEGAADRAAATALRVLAVVHPRKASDEEIAARILLAHAYLKQGKLAEAKSALAAAVSVGPSQECGAPLKIAVLSARIEGATGKPGVERALLSLAASEREAAAAGLLGDEMEIRLARGELEIRSGDAAGGKEHLAALARAATAKGYLLLARQATAAHPPAP